MVDMIQLEYFRQNYIKSKYDYYVFFKKIQQQYILNEHRKYNKTKEKTNDREKSLEKNTAALMKGSN